MDKPTRGRVRKVDLLPDSIRKPLLEMLRGAVRLVTGHDAGPDPRGNQPSDPRGRPAGRAAAFTGGHQPGSLP